MTRALPLFALAAMSFIDYTAIAADYTAEVTKFRAEREKSLVAEDGWTTVVGLAWLKEGDNRAGSDPKAEVELPASLPAQVGVFTLKSGHVHFQPASGVKLPARVLAGNRQVLPDPAHREIWRAHQGYSSGHAQGVQPFELVSPRFVVAHRGP